MVGVRLVRCCVAWRGKEDAVDLGAVVAIFSGPQFFDYLSVIVGGITGALFACDRDLDIVGTITLGLMTGYGGGVVRDMLLQDHGFYFMEHPDLIILTACLCAFVFFFQGVFKHLDSTVFFADALSVGLFALAGASKAVACDVGFVLAALLGAITAVGGGALRDVCVGEIPGVFQESNFYAVAGLGGSVLFVAMATVGINLTVSSIACVIAVIMLRYWSVYFDWRTSAAHDLTPVVSRSLKAMATTLFIRGGEAGTKRRFSGIFHRRTAGRGVVSGVREERLDEDGFFAREHPGEEKTADGR